MITLNPTGMGNRLTNDHIDRLVSGEASIVVRYHEWSKPKVIKLNAANRATFEQSKRDGFYYKPNSSRTTPLAFLCHYWQETNNRPMIDIRARGGTCDVQCDLVSIPLAIQDRWSECARSAVSELVASLGGRILSFGTYTRIKVLAPTAEACARGLVQIFDRLAGEP